MSTYEIFIACDHHGVAAKLEINQFLTSLGYMVHDLGTDSSEELVDYPDYAKRVAEKVADQPQKRRGILLCGTGIGMCMVANRFSGILAAQVWNEEMAARASGDDAINVLCLASDYLTSDQCIVLVDTWLKTPFSNTPRYIKRLASIAELDKNR